MLFMGFLDFLAGAVEVADTLIDKSEYYYVQCDTVEVFELGEIWQGTARIHGAGKHISTDRASYSNTFMLYDGQDREGMRDKFRKWLADTFSSEYSAPDEALVLNSSENCLSFEGFAKKDSGKWMITSSYQSASNYVSYKLFVYKQKKKNSLDGKTILGRKELSYLFMDATKIRVSVEEFET